MNPDHLYDEPFVVAVWAKKEGRVHESEPFVVRNRVHVQRVGKKWTIMIRNKSYEEQDAVSEGLTSGPQNFTNFKYFWVSNVEFKLFSGEAPSAHTNWDEIIEACKSCIVSNTRRITAIRARNTIARKREDAAAAARANPPVPLRTFTGVPETMAQTRARQAKGEPLRNAEGLTELEAL